jgi:hypothetical protein
MKRTPLQIALRKRAEALASIEVRRRSIARLEARVAALDAEIAAMGGRKLTLTPRLPFRAKGEMQRALFDLLREKGRATAADLAAVMLARYGLNASDKRVAYAMRQRCIQAFRRCERRGLVKCVGRSKGKRRKAGRFKLWALRA